MSYNCNKCQKIFKYESKLESHKNNKIPCNKPKEDLKCDICNINFVRPAHKLIHEKTDKHINNYNKLNNKIETSNNILLDENNSLKLQLIEFTKKLDLLVNDKNNIINILNKKIDLLNEKIKYLDCENQNLKNNNKIHEKHEYIYIIHCAQYINTNIYKIGRTKNIINRIKDYPKGSELILTISCNDSIKMEKHILSYLKKTDIYYHCKDIGNEYFKCDLDNLKNDIQTIISDNN